MQQGTLESMVDPTKQGRHTCSRVYHTVYLSTLLHRSLVSPFQIQQHVRLLDEYLRSFFPGPILTGIF